MTVLHLTSHGRPNTGATLTLAPAGDFWGQALCKDVHDDTFYPDSSLRKAARDRLTENAKLICNGAGGIGGCPIRTQCLTYALDNGEQHGVWGGYDEDQRQLLDLTQPETEAS